MGCPCSAAKKIADAVSHVAHGAVGLAKAATGIDRPPEQIIEERRKICRACPHAVPCVANVGKRCKCAKCGCLLRAKTAVMEESCPLQKWVAVNIQTKQN